MVGTRHKDEAAIRQRAHQLWEQAGRPEGRDMEFWTLAEVSLAAPEQMQEVNAPPPKPGATAARAKKQ